MIWVDRIPAFNDNYIWALRSDNSQVTAIVDPGDAKPVLEYLKQHDLDLGSILITHHHNDHIGGLSELMRHFSPEVYGPLNENIPLCTQKVHDQDEITLPSLDLTFKILDVPGHTKGHIAYLGHQWLFCGDTLFAGGCGRLFEGTAAQMYDSLKKLSRLPAETQVFCAHEYTQSNLQFALSAEPDNKALQQRIREVAEMRKSNLATVPSTIDLENQTNPFLRSHIPRIRQRIETLFEKPLSTNTEVFTALRKWKDNF